MVDVHAVPALTERVMMTGKTPLLEMAANIDVISTETVRSLRDHALIATLTYSFARIGAAPKMRSRNCNRRALTS